MRGPQAIVLSPGPLDPMIVRRALGEQGGPDFDRTVFRMLRGVDLGGLLHGAPGPGSGTAVVVASSAWWLRPVDDLVDRIVAEAQVPVAALVEGEGIAFLHESRPGVGPERALRDNVEAAWEMLRTRWSLPTRSEALLPLSAAAVLVHEDAEEGRSLPPLVLISERPGDSESVIEACLTLRGSALVAGRPWSPGAWRAAEGPVPTHLRAIVLAGPVRLPGPARWALARRAEAVEVALQVGADDGWMLLVPEVEGQPAHYGAITCLRQFAPLPRGRWIGVLEPRTAARVLRIDGDDARHLRAHVDPLPVDLPDGDDLDSARAALLRVAEGKAPARALHDAQDAEDPARSIAWSVPVPLELGLAYLAAETRSDRAHLLSRALGLTAP